MTPILIAISLLVLLAVFAPVVAFWIAGVLALALVAFVAVAVFLSKGV